MTVYSIIICEDNCENTVLDDKSEDMYIDDITILSVRIAEIYVNKTMKYEIKKKWNVKKYSGVIDNKM